MSKPGALYLGQALAPQPYSAILTVGLQGMGLTIRDPFLTTSRDSVAVCYGKAT